MAITANKKFWTEFIDIYHSLPCLWNTKDESYNSRECRSIARNKLVQKLQEVEPDANQDAVKRKINTFRSNFNREVRKMRQTQKIQSTEVYNPTLWYFDHLSFLLNQEKYSGNGVSLDDSHYDEDVTLMGLMNTAKSEIVEENETVKDDSVNQDEVPLTDNDVNPAHEAVINNNSPPVPEAKRHKRDKYADAEDNATPRCKSPEFHINNKAASESPLEYERPSNYRKLHSTKKSRIRSNPYSKTQVRNNVFSLNALDEAAIYGQSWACGFRKLSPQQKLFAKKAIDEILILGQLKALKLHTIPMDVNSLQEPSDGE